MVMANCHVTRDIHISSYTARKEIPPLSDEERGARIEITRVRFAKQGATYPSSGTIGIYETG